MRLSQTQRMQLFKALTDAYSSRESLEGMVSLRLGENLEMIAGDHGALGGTLRRLMQWAESRDCVGRVVAAALDDNPANVSLKELANFGSLLTGVPDDGEYLEKILLPSAGFSDPEEWRSRSRRCEASVCRIEFLDGDQVARPQGTGFLVAADIAMTNYHVLEPILKGSQASTTVVMRFDYRVGDDGVSIDAGRSTSLALDWRIDDSPVRDLDYAVVRLADRVGADEIGTGPKARQRGWLKPIAHQFSAQEPLLILQHPMGKPIKQAVGPSLGAMAGNRVEHRVNTEPGSSGSPVFTSQWDLVALHHYGDDQRNRAVPFSAILDAMVGKGTATHLAA